MSKGYADWKGKIAFVGIQFEGTLAGEILYGWLRISVADDGNRLPYWIMPLMKLREVLL